MKKNYLILLLLFSYSIMNVRAQNYQDSLSTELSRHYDESNLPGFSVAIVNEQGTLYEEGFGYANILKKTPFLPTTVQNIASITKTIVGLALVIAVEDGKISFDTGINAILPFDVVNPYFQDTPILIRHLITHTSSILDTQYYGKSYVGDGNSEYTEDINQDFLDFIKSHEKIELDEFLFRILSPEGTWYKKKNFNKAKPGTKYEYSNLNAALAAYIIEIITGISFQEYTKEKIFQPLKMQSTGWSYEDIEMGQAATLYFPMGKVVPHYSLITYPDGGLLTSVSDLSLYLREMIKAHNGDSEYLLPPYSNLLLPGDHDENRAFWGMGIESRNIGHGGSDPGVQTDMQFNADSHIGRIIFSNVNAEDNAELWEQYRKIHNILAKYEANYKNSIQQAIPMK